MGNSKSTLLRPFKDRKKIDDDDDNGQGPFYTRQSQPNYQHEGWLSKQTISKKFINTSKWKDRYFIAKHGVLIYYIVNDQQIYSLSNLDKIGILNDKPNLLTNQVIGYEFQLYFKTINHKTKLEIDDDNNDVSQEDDISSNILTFATITKKDLDYIIGIFSGYCGEDIPAIQSSANSPTHSHKIELYYCHKGMWHIYYCIVEHDILKLYKKNQRGMLSLLNAKVEDINKDKHTFTLVAANDNRLNLCAHNKQNFRRWIASLEKEILEASNLQVPHSDLNLKDLEYFGRLHSALEKEDHEIETKRREMSYYNSAASTFATITLPFRKKHFIILSIDGGGIRGILNTIILERIVKKYPHFLDSIDLFTGTSNGGMTAAGLAFGRSPSICRTVTELCSKTIFGETQTYTSINKAKYSNKYLKMLCDEVFKNKRLSDAPKKLVIPALQMKNSIDLAIFHNLDDNYDDQRVDERASDVVMRTIAAPIYFPSFQGFVDGGMFAHDPSTIALTCAMSNLGHPIDNIVMLSLGTGWVDHEYKSDTDYDWGYKQWLPKLPTVLWDSMVLKSQWMCEKLLAERFLRVNPTLDSDIAMDDPNQIAILTEIANNFDIDFIDNFIKTYF